MVGLGGFMRHALADDRPSPLLTRLPEPTVYPQRKERLARELSRASWVQVTTAYAHCEVAVGLSSIFKSASDALERPTKDEHLATFRAAAQKAATELERAQLHLAPRTSKPGIWAGHRARLRH